MDILLGTVIITVFLGGLVPASIMLWIMVVRMLREKIDKKDE